MVDTTKVTYANKADAFRAGLDTRKQRGVKSILVGKGEEAVEHAFENAAHRKAFKIGQAGGKFKYYRNRIAIAAGALAAAGAGLYLVLSSRAKRAKASREAIDNAATPAMPEMPAMMPAQPTMMGMAPAPGAFAQRVLAGRGQAPQVDGPINPEVNVGAEAQDLAPTR